MSASFSLKEADTFDRVEEHYARTQWHAAAVDNFENPPFLRPESSACLAMRNGGYFPRGVVLGKRLQQESARRFLKSVVKVGIELPYRVEELLVFSPGGDR